MQHDPRRLSRSRCFALLLITIALGLASRRWAAALPKFVATYAGDALWAVAAYWALALARPLGDRRLRGLCAFGIAVTVEVSQLLHPSWLEALRQTRLGGWLLGFGFLWSDLVCYAVGVAAVMVLDRLLTTESVAGSASGP